MSTLDLERLKILLDETHSWPSEYLFKFIIPVKEREHFLALTMPLEWSEKPSREGNYLAMNATHRGQNSEEILHIYRQVITIKGIITL